MQQRSQTDKLFSYQRSTATLVLGSLLFLVNRSSASLYSERQHDRFTRTKGRGSSDSVNETIVTPALIYVGEPPLDPNVTYGACEGRCSRHEHCQSGLFCIQRVPNDEIISTCLPQLSSDPKNESAVVTNTLRLLNYCAEVPANELVTLTEGNTSEVTITSACSGGCLADSDCLGDHLRCSRPNATSISGCSGYKHPLVNYCYVDNTATTITSNSSIVNGNGANTTNLTIGGSSLEYVGEPPFPSLLLECQGDCDSDWHCDYGLNCFKRSDDTPIPGCDGAGGKEDIYSVDYCYSPPNGTLVIVQNATTSSIKAGKCEGNCETDDHCASGLKCFLRQHYEAVPGCVGVGAYSTNYCFNPADEDFNGAGTVEPSKSPTRSATSIPIAPIEPVSLPTAFPTLKSNIIPPTPTVQVSIPTANPSGAPSIHPNQSPSGHPSNHPSTLPSNIPSATPSSLIPSFRPSENPSGIDAFSSIPSENPTFSISEKPSETPTFGRSENPSEKPIFLASSAPSDTPSLGSDNTDRDVPTLLPTRKDGSIVNPPVESNSDSTAPSKSPSSDPLQLPLSYPSLNPSSTPSSRPSTEPSDVPTVTKSNAPSSFPSSNPSDESSSRLTSDPSQIPSEIPSTRPSFVPFDFPSSVLSSVPSSNLPDALSSSPSTGPSDLPTVYPSLAPSKAKPVDGGLLPDETCPDFVVLGRARAIFQRLMNVFQYKNNEIVHSNDTTSTRIGTFARSYQQAAYEWLVDTDEQVICSNATNLVQRYALAVFWFACGGDNWSMSTKRQSNSFLSKTVGECQWNGISCDHNDNVFGLHFDESNIMGTLPIELASLKFLRELNIDTNHLSGPIPAWFSQWKELEVLDLDHNKLTGTIPSSLYSISKLRVLDLDSNALTGTISETGIGNWINDLFFLQLDFNKFVGTIPSVLGKFSNLQYLSLFGNNFTSTLLSSIENLCEGIVTIYANCDMCENSTCCTACLDV